MGESKINELEKAQTNKEEPSTALVDALMSDKKVLNAEVLKLQKQVKSFEQEHPKYIELEKVNTELLEKQKIETEKLAEANKKLESIKKEVDAKNEELSKLKLIKLREDQNSAKEQPHPLSPVNNAEIAELKNEISRAE